MVIDGDDIMNDVITQFIFFEEEIDLLLDDSELLNEVLSDEL